MWGVIWELRQISRVPEEFFQENKVDPCFLNQCGTLVPSGVDVKLDHKLKYIICNLN